MSFAWQERKLKLAEWFEERSLRNLRAFRSLVTSVSEKKLLQIGRSRAELAAQRAWRTVPAYRNFLSEHGSSPDEGSFEDLPVMTKDNYVRKYPTRERCAGGGFLAPGVAIDESSGSTGVPYNWVRGSAERLRMRRQLARMLDWAIDQRPRITINAFSMGAWATGVNIGEAMELHGVVKSTGPDLEKILHTLEFFGPQPGYFICAYPPFLKLILDSMLKRGFPVDEYELRGLVGGEGMSEEFRRHLLRHFKSCHSGYGASDLAMGIGVETPEAIHIRGILNDDPELRTKLLDGDHRVPMVFQYNPTEYFLETTDRGELVCTLNYSKMLSPRVRYNIGDEARLFVRSELLRKCADLGRNVETDHECRMEFPYLFIFGRQDQTISLMGANIYAEDMERVIYAQPDLAEGYSSFSMRIHTHDDATMSPQLFIEWCDDSPPRDLDPSELATRIEQGLAELNSDYHNAKTEYADALKFEVELHARGTGPFASRGRKIKNRYLAR